MDFIIYKITNTVNDKVYIGCTKKTIEERLLGHISRAKRRKRKSKLYNAMNEIGVENFKIKKILKIDIGGIENIEAAYSLERLYINHYDSFENGYNSTTGGQQDSKVSSEVREKLKNRKFPKEYWEKIRKSKTGQRRTRAQVESCSATYLVENRNTGFKKEIRGLKYFCEENNISRGALKHTVYRRYFTRDGWRATKILDKGEQIG